MKRQRRAGKVIAVVLIVVFLAGCSTSPKKISASYVSPTEYSHLECDQIRSELSQVKRELSQITGQQESEATKDAVALSVGLVIFWSALFFMIGDDKKEEISLLKGKYEALETSAIEKKCSYAPEIVEGREERKKLEAELKKKEEEAAQKIHGGTDQYGNPWD